MSIPFGHHQLHNRYTFTGQLQLETALRISAGVASDETDAPFIRTASGKPYIPGTSLRGAIRAELERILAAVGESATGMASCLLFEPEGCADKVNDHLKALREKEEKKNKKDRKTEDQLLAQAAADKLCAICRLFGSTMYAARLTIGDALPVEDSKEPTGAIRDGVGIDRDTGAASDGAKFDYEVLEPGVDGPFFSFRMQVENVATESDKKLITLILRLLTQGLQAGGKKAAGMGRIKLRKIDGLHYRTTCFADPQALWQSLQSGNELVEQSVTWQEVL
ncbi:MAG: CRISPR-associated RAMP protein [Proteobacteria bacterium]|nr:CRISPR-associated RAMP protein [Pseudomonadota bacterium]MBU4298308.1 CRISPR-associated RAMP protein [Pseudomonadota bacterium]MCG2749694.1 CRISPR-associated RAMP protein Csx7 [Desulfobulbaceae bacterium]